MKILICDEYNNLGENAMNEKKYIQSNCPKWDVEIYPYKGDREEWIKKIAGSDAVISAFLCFDRELIKEVQGLKCISVNATGYGNVDVKAASDYGIGVMAIEEYCTQEVAEHTISVILALNRNLKQYIYDIDYGHNWQYIQDEPPKRVSGQKIGIFGYGKIGHAVAKYARAIGMQVYIYNNNRHAITDITGIRLASAEEIYEQCSIITNHMAQTPSNYKFFDRKAFSLMKQRPYFINMGRGEAVDEGALAEALDQKQLRGAALDVLDSENPNIESNSLVRRDNVLITPHAAFYSEESIQAMVKKSCDNMIYFLNQSFDKIHKLINPGIVGR